MAHILDLPPEIIRIILRYLYSSFLDDANGIMAAGQLYRKWVSDVARDTFGDQHRSLWGLSWTVPELMARIKQTPTFFPALEWEADACGVHYKISTTKIRQQRHKLHKH